MAGHAHHGIDYIEFTVKDMKASQAFYAKAFGWEFTDYSPGYAGIKAKADSSQEMGGFAVGEPQPGGPLIVLYSHDLEASLASAKEAGAEIVKDVFEFPGGRRFEFKDPNGYMLAMATYNH
mmetsp:Transcript_6635/g.14473  ORF Transcript_6635/g.14473 Transcript_6635/m.14473 type:complete len:121 (-) Transcript_6635:281-643(-)